MSKEYIFRKLSFKFTVGFFLLAFLVSSVTFTIGFVKYKETIGELYHEMAYTLADVAVSYIDGDKIGSYLETKTPDAAYEAMGAKLDLLLKNSKADYLFVYVPKGGLIHYIYDAKNSKMPQDALGNTDPISEKHKESVLEIYNTGQQSNGNFISKSRYGYNTSAILPIKNSNGEVTAMINVDVPMLVIQSSLRGYMLTAAVIGTLLVFCIVFIYLAYLNKTVIQPIRLITEDAEAFVRHRTGFSEEILKIKTGDEIETLSSALAKMEIDIEQYISNLAKVTADKERIETELNVAKHIQASMLPNIFPAFPNRSDMDIYATMLPAKEVGGDFYDFFLVDETHLCVVMADVSGKGVPAALFMVIAKSLIKNYTQLMLTPSEVFTKANNQLCEGNEAEMFVTAFMGILDLETGVFTYTNAGHNPPLIKRKGGNYEWLKPPAGFVLAGMEGVKYKESVLTLEKGDTMYLYTDGVTEAMDESNKLFSDEKLHTVLNQNKDVTLKDLLANVKKEIDIFVGSAPQFDDITMLALSYKETPKEEN